jgi:diguanylate cyclase (GGDEF)-like protein
VKISFEISTLGVWVQGASAILVFLLFLLLSRGHAPAFHRWWTAAWGCLAIALVALGLGFTAAPPVTVWAYQFFELLFALFLWKGARALAGRQTPRSRTLLFLAGSLAAWTTGFSAFLLTSTKPGPTRLSALFAIHAALMGAGYLAAALEAGRAARAKRGLGPGLLAAALGLLALLFFFYTWATYFTLNRGHLVADFMYYSTFLDVLLQFAAAFSMLVCRTEHDQQRLSEVHLGLATAHRELVHTYALLRDESERDALTDAYNRTAFRHFFTEGGARFARGCVALIDMNSLKSINDRHGHDVGDRAIRLVADAIRGLFRAEDPLFRWGGDEFLLLLPQADAADTARRLSRLNTLLASSWEGPPPMPQACWGIAEFESRSDFTQMLKEADAKMYEAKRLRAREGA